MGIMAEFHWDATKLRFVDAVSGYGVHKRRLNPWGNAELSTGYGTKSCNMSMMCL